MLISRFNASRLALQKLSAPFKIENTEQVIILTALTVWMALLPVVYLVAEGTLVVLLVQAQAVGTHHRL